MAWHHTNWRSHPTVRTGDELSVGERMADRAVRLMGSWRFLIFQTCFIFLWIAGNVAAVVFRFDPYPFILLNLAFSTQAAYAAPLILLGQRRSDNKAREIAQASLDADQQALEILLRLEDRLQLRDPVTGRYASKH